MNELNRTWQECLKDIENNLNKPAFEAWFKNISPVAIEDNIFIISCPNDLTKNWVESRHVHLIKRAVAKTIGQTLEIKIISQKEGKQKEEPLGNEEIPAPEAFIEKGGFNPKYTFDSFIIGDCNRFAHAAAMAVAEKPFKTYNPLFIYGGVGLGKTHLLRAIGNYILKSSPKYKAKYITTEEFTNNFINAIRYKEMDSFQKKYRSNDILLVDDIQFIEGKVETQREFFHTFNSLFESGRQIVITSDRIPSKLSTLEERLTSRFEMGLITDIQPPDIETRIAILRKYREHQPISVPDDVIAFIASRIEANIRELEGALTRVIAFSSLIKNTIDLPLAKEVLREILPEKHGRKITPKMIQEEAARYFNISLSDLSSERRSHEIAYPRQIAIYLARELTDLSLLKIGELFGGKDHSTIIYAVKKIGESIKNDPDTYHHIQRITTSIKNR